jgi:glycosyltransferase involved in cell wall biosynthesis
MEEAAVLCAHQGTAPEKSATINIQVKPLSELSADKKHMANSPPVSVIIPAYNAGAYIEEAIRSVLDQDYPDLDVIVVDDGSTDGTAERVAAFAPHVQCLRQRNSGGYPGVPRNTGMQQCRGEFICFLDADDIMCPGRIRRQVDFLSEHPQVGVVFTDYLNFTADGLAGETHFETCARLQRRLVSLETLVLSSGEATALLLKENFGIPSAMMIRREVLGQIPGFSSELQTSEDFHFYFRVARRYSLGVIREVGVHRRLHGGNITSDSLRTLKNYIASRTDLKHGETNPSNVDLLNRFLRRCEIDLARAYANRREYGNSIAHNLRAFDNLRSVSLVHLGLALRTLIRTAAIATHIKSPCP